MFFSLLLPWTPWVILRRHYNCSQSSTLSLFLGAWEDCIFPFYNVTPHINNHESRSLSYLNLKTGICPLNSQWTFQPSSIHLRRCAEDRSLHTNSAFPPFYSLHNSRNPSCVESFPGLPVKPLSSCRGSGLLCLLSTLSHVLYSSPSNFSISYKYCVPWPSPRITAHSDISNLQFPMTLFFSVNSYESFTSQLIHHNFWYIRNNKHMWLIE